MGGHERYKKEKENRVYVVGQEEEGTRDLTGIWEKDSKNSVAGT